MASAAEKLAALPGASSKTRMRKLQCSDECGYPPVRASRAAIRVGLPVCCCGAVLWPWDLDDIELARSAGHLVGGLYDRHPLIVEFRREWERVTRGQHGHVRRQSTLQPADAIASLRVMVSVGDDNRRARLDAIRGQAAARQALHGAAATGAVAREALTRDTDPIPF